MSESVAARLREHVAYARHTSRDYLIETDALAALLGIAEAVATVEPIDDEFGVCIYCDARASLGEGTPHSPDCPYRRARELCGMEQDGAK